MRFPFLSVDPKKQFNEYEYSPIHLSRIEEQPVQNLPGGCVRSQGRATGLRLALCVHCLQWTGLLY